MSPALISNTKKVSILKDRAFMLMRCREFFAQRSVCEVDVPILSYASSVDAYIDPVQASCCGKTAYLHTSPEYGMKRLLSEGMGDIFQISHVFRDHEVGQRHTSEFMLAEWYRVGISFQKMIAETVEFIRLFINDIPMDYEQFSYEEMFRRFLGYYPHSLEERDKLLAFEIEPQLGQRNLSVVQGFPAELAALSTINAQGLAQRFEVYYQGIELANGYHELTDVQEQTLRITHANEKRMQCGKAYLPPDAHFLTALERGIPDCSGVAVGFDRLMMLRHQLKDIREVSCFFI